MNKKVKELITEVVGYISRMDVRCKYCTVAQSLPISQRDYCEEQEGEDLIHRHPKPIYSGDNHRLLYHMIN